MILTIILAVLVGVAGAAALYWISIKKKKEEIEHDNEVVPYSLGNKTIYLTRDEIPHFEALGRKEQRAIINRFEAKVKSGKFIPVRENGKIIGFKRPVKNK
jgi:hypothetical protein